MPFSRKKWSHFIKKLGFVRLGEKLIYARQRERAKERDGESERKRERGRENERERERESKERGGDKRAFKKESEKCFATFVGMHPAE